MAKATSDAERVPVETFAHGLGDKVLACRELGHIWRPATVEVVREGRSLGGYVRTFRCSQCRTERHQVLDSRAGIVNNRYVYPDGYLATHVDGGFSRDVFRLESISRWLDRHPDA